MPVALTANRFHAAALKSASSSTAQGPVKYGSESQGFPTRPNMVQQLLDVGFDYYNLPSSDGSHYWSDNVAYEFTLAEIDRIEDATNELHAMCMDLLPMK